MPLGDHQGMPGINRMGVEDSDERRVLENEVIGVRVKIAAEPSRSPGPKCFIW